MTILLLLGFWLAQQMPAGPHHTVTGTVVNGATGEPVNHALVRLWGAGSGTFLTGSDGRFEMPDVPEGTLLYSATKPGFSENFPSSGRRMQSSIKVGAGDNDIRITLQPSARIVGRVSDGDGEPIEQLSVQAMFEGVTNGRKQWVTRGSAETDDDGTYRIDDLQPGRYILFSSGRAVPESQQVIAPAYYPDGSDIATAQEIDLQPGQEFTADFKVRPQNGFRVSGTIAANTPTLGVGVNLETQDGRFIGVPVRVDLKKGTFRADAVPKGNWLLLANANDGRGGTSQARQEVAVDGSPIDNLRIVLHPMVRIPVTVNHAATDQQRGGGNFVLTSTDPAEQVSYWAASRDANSGPAFDNVQPGKYSLDVQNTFGECIESAWAGGIDLLRNNLVVGADTQPDPIVINMTTQCGSLRAERADGDKQTATLLVVPASGVAPPKLVPVFPNSALRLTPGNMGLTLPPGSYRVYAFTDVSNLEYTNPEVMRTYPSQEIELSAGQTLDLSVTPSDPKLK